MFAGAGNIPLPSPSLLYGMVEKIGRRLAGALAVRGNRAAGVGSVRAWCGEEGSMIKGWSLVLVALMAVVVPACEKASSADPVYEAFRAQAAADGITLSQYAGYTGE